ncbi:FAD-dependent monooxygenase [Kibdelosporangium phytohabitans]|uniref:FAD-dependent oxidoreductase n=1 Tax=Kibdelosporangium phytohabitans TaxID=860235 RepID=A0A0N9I383_9PSEU|nr:FAD-dependent monooxygenase [Kibdelosporangium phytohabitans]ALG08710.1 FAD-dependent oxidoreductase [Kibdelosporangium phytohabitans]MBE1470179.1 2-polyprenyl-6-methoxyphenol hydroxylase-like FAD-dependent oxidoreductase [Kibdelosporangium phytohabitans]
MTKGSILISGAGIAGPALAYWLHRYGFDVTVVEKAPAVRSGGYPIDIRGTALDVVERMGLLPRLRAAHVDSRRITFLHPDGSPVASVAADKIVGNAAGRDLEIARGDLTATLYDAVRDTCEFVFSDSIAALAEDTDGVDVTFTSRQRRRFDLVIGADGLHSNTRGHTSGPEEQFHRYLGYCFAGFTMPNDFGLSHEGVVWNAPGRSGVLYAAGDNDHVHAFLIFTRAEPPLAAFRDPAAQRDVTASAFAGDQWEIPRMVAAMRTADDLFFDVVSQIHMPSWARGRVAVVGDAAHAPSFLSGQGTSIALVSAYMLAGALAAQPDHTSAFATYERETRRFVELNQALATDGRSAVTPETAEALAQRNAALLDPDSFDGDTGRPEHSALTLPTFA